MSLVTHCTDVIHTLTNSHTGHMWAIYYLHASQKIDRLNTTEA